MKKLLTLLAIAMVATTASAVTIKWTSDSISFGSTKVGKNATGYLVFIGNNALGSEGYTWNDIIGMSDVSHQATNLSKMNVSAVDVGDSPVGNYVMYATYTSEGKTYYNVASPAYSLTQANIDALLNEGTSIPAANFSLASTVNNADAAGTIGGGWYLKQTTPTPDVPEPATGALALAGVALLFKRRRA